MKAMPLLLKLGFESRMNEGDKEQGGWDTEQLLKVTHSNFGSLDKPNLAGIIFLQRY